jgi:hypothetical protein
VNRAGMASRALPIPPRLAPGTVVILAGPDVRYVVGSLETSGPDAVLHLRTEDGEDWAADRPAS